MTTSVTRARAAIAIAMTIGVAIAAGGCESSLASGSRRTGGALACAPICDADAECGPGTRCVAGRCVGWALRDRCTVDLECGSARTICGRDEDCAEGEACVDPGGGIGRCAWMPDLGIACDRFGEELELPRISGEPARVCLDRSATCRGGSCSDECASDAECTRVGAPHCDALIGECVCRVDADCVGPSAATCIEGVCIGGAQSCDASTAPAM